MLDATAHHTLDRPETAPFHTRNAAPCYGNWGVCYTQPQAERWAQANLTRNGYVTYLPLITVTRRDRVIRSLRHTVELPAFPRYLFVQHDNPDLWRPIRETPGVAAVIQCGNRMQYASPGAIEAVQAALAVRPHPERLWTPGTPCSLAQGALYGLPAVVTQVHTTTDTATVTIMMLGCLRSVTVPLDTLAPRENS